MVDQRGVATRPKIETSCHKCGALAGQHCLKDFHGTLITQRDMTLYAADRRTGCAVDEIPF